MIGLLRAQVVPGGLIERQSSVRYKPIQGFLGYEVGEDGSVWTYWKSAARSHGKGSVKILSNQPKAMKLTTYNNGYLYVTLYSDGKPHKNRSSRFSSDRIRWPETRRGQTPSSMPCGWRQNKQRIRKPAVGYS
jgi:hypothetical protein